MAIFQYSADDTGFQASEQRRINKERRDAAAKASNAAVAANPTGKPALELLKVSKNPAMDSVFDESLKQLKADLSTTQPFQLKALDALRADNNVKMQAAVNEDVAKIGRTAEQYAKDTRATADKYGALINEGRDLGVDLATGGLERARMSKSPYLGYGTANTYDAVQAYAPVFNQAAQRGQEINQSALDRILASDRGTIGQREGILSAWDTFNRGQLGDRQRLQAGNIANLGSLSRVYNDMNFLGVGGQTGNAPYSLPSNLSNFRPPQYAAPNRGGVLDRVAPSASPSRPAAKANAWELYKQWKGYYPNDKRHAFDRDMYEMLGGEVRDLAAQAAADISGYPDDRQSFDYPPAAAGPLFDAAPPTGGSFTYPAPYKDNAWNETTMFDNYA